MKRNSKQEVAAASPRVEDDPEVRNFLSSYVATGRRVYELERALEAADLTIDKLTGRSNYLEQELKRCQHVRDRYQASYAELKAQFRIIASSSREGLKNVVDTIEKVLAQAQADMQRDGVTEAESVTETPITVDELEENLKRIGETFGANARKETNDELDGQSK
jgi:hypothetical protein